jgi:hypothetical protein
MYPFSIFKVMDVKVSGINFDFLSPYHSLYVSRFRNVTDRIAQEIDIWTAVTTDAFKGKVEAIRATNDKDKRSTLKKQMPCFTPSGFFAGRTACSSYSGFICIDIDAKDNPHVADVEKLKLELSKLTNVAYAGLSVGGKGLFVLIPVKYPEKHKEHCYALFKDFKRMGIKPDEACSDMTRLRIMSYDSNAYINKEAVLYKKLITQSNSIQKPADRHKKITYKPICNNDILSKVTDMVNKINKAGVDITGGYQQWFEIGCALANTFGERGCEFFHAVSQYSNKYDITKTDQQFNHCYCHSYRNITIGSFFYYAKQAGIK